MRSSLLQGLMALVFTAQILAQDKVPGDPKKAERVEQILTARCAECHGSKLKTPKGGFGKVNSLASLAADPEYVVRGEPDRSELFTRVRDKEMPPPKDREPLSASETAELKGWIESLKGGEGPRRFIDDEEVATAIHGDLSKVWRESKVKMSRMRYLTLTHLYNLGEPEDALELYREAVTKLYNSLSWSQDLVKPVAIDAARTILRFDLLDVEWDEAVWNRIVARYPYAILSDSPSALGIYGATRVSPPHIRGDWFVFEASRPPLYHEILKLPSTVKDLEKLLGVDSEADTRNQRVIRAGFQESKVSQGNRTITRHRLRSGGYYWASRDFPEAKVGGDSETERRKSIFKCPLAPGDAGERAEGLEGFVFEAAGGEMIFSLPNGLQGYYLANGAGARIDEGPYDIVRDEGKVVINGYSCMSCHSVGMQPASDEIREHVNVPNAFPQRVVNIVNGLHPEAGVLKRALDEDTERFQKALVQVGVRVSATLEPVKALVARFEAPLRVKEAAAEFGLLEKDLTSRAQVTPEGLRNYSQLKGKGLPRKEFISVFAGLVKELDLGEVNAAAAARIVKEPTRAPDVKPAAPVTAKVKALPWAEVLEERVNASMVTDAGFRAGIEKTGLPWRVREKVSGVEMLLVPAGEYMRGVSPGDAEAYDNEKPQHKVTITSAFYLGRYELTQGEWLKVMGNNPSGFKGNDRLPVEQVSFDDLKPFLVKTGLRLPSEGEWEYAARAGTRGSRYGELDEVAWHSGNSESKTYVVGGKSANALGFSDMLGNVWEWCSDVWDSGEYARHEGGVSDPQGLGGDEKSSRVVRGGSWLTIVMFVRSSHRGVGNPSSRSHLVGVRLATTP